MSAAGSPWLGALGIWWLNLYLVRHAFTIPFTGQMHSMHGFWEAVGRYQHQRGFFGHWLDAFAGGTPIEYAYAPLVPWLAYRFGAPSVCALAFCAGPVALYFLAWRLRRSAPVAFAAAAAYSLLSPSQLLAPDGVFAWAHLFDARRLAVTFVWDEAPHELGLAGACVAAAAWTGGQRLFAALALALGALSSPFAFPAGALLGLCWGIAAGWRHLSGIALSGVVAYLLVLPFYPPSLLAVIARNSATTPEAAWTSTSWLALATAGALLGATHGLTRRADSSWRFAALAAVLFTSIPVLFYRGGLRFLDQPGRYKTELELAVALLAVLAAAHLPRRIRHGVAALAVALAVWLTIEHRRYAKREIVVRHPRDTIEFQVAQWAGLHLRGQTIFAPGSIAQWLNTFAEVRQFTGGSYPTVPNAAQPALAEKILYATDWQQALVWLRQAHVNALVVAGPASPEFWKPLNGRDIYRDHLPVLWRERDTAIYAVPDSTRAAFTRPFDGGWEFRVCRGLSLLTVAGIALAILRTRHARA